MGSTCVNVLADVVLGNHPHVYGEYELSQKHDEIAKESPPCVWGVHLRAIRTLIIRGITPMCMGST